MAEDFRHNPEFSLRNFPLEPNCKELALRNATEMNRPSFTFNVSTFPTGIITKKQRAPLLYVSKALKIPKVDSLIK